MIRGAARGAASKSGQQPGVWSDFSSKAKDCRYLDKMLDLLERRLPYLCGKANRVEIVSTRLGVALDLPQDVVMALRIGARYCDVGLLGVPDAILSAERPFDAADHRLVDTHVRLSGQLLNLAFYDFPEVLETVWFHHERVDGKGPFGVRGPDIPPTAQILSVADAIESMYSGRPHRPRMAADAIVAELHKCAATQFDTRIVHLASRIQLELFASLLERDGPDPSEAAAEPGPPPPATGEPHSPPPAPADHPPPAAPETD